MKDGRLLAALGLSGAAALGYELAWTRLLGLVLGHELIGVWSALAGFFAGMAMGAWWAHSRVREHPNPGRLYVRLELAAASFAAVSPWALHWIAGWLPKALGVGAGSSGFAIAAALCTSTLLLLPGTFCLGATLPAVVEARRRAAPSDPQGRSFARMYGAQTLGATVGIVLAVHVLIPAIGVGGSTLVASALAVAAALLVGSDSRWTPTRAPYYEQQLGTEPVDPHVDTSRDPDPHLLEEPFILYVLLIGTGIAGLGLQVVGVRVLAQVAEGTVYGFSDIVAVFLVGTAIGALVYARLSGRALGGMPARVLWGLLLGLALSTCLAAFVMRLSPGLRTALAGQSPASRHLADAAVALAVFGVPTVLMGATFSHLIALVGRRGVGRALAANGLAAATAPFVFGLLAIGRLGLTDAWFALGWTYLGLTLLFGWFRRFPTAWQLAAVLAVPLCTFGAAYEPASSSDDEAQARPALLLIELPEGWKLLARQEGPLGVVTVSERFDEAGTASGLRRLQVNQHFRMGGALGIGERRMGHLPLLMAPEPREILFLGMGTGATAGAALAHDSVERVDVVELVPEVIEMLPYFEAVNAGLGTDPRVVLHAADARRFLAAQSQRYDVVVADLFHPARDGAGTLYAREHFEAVRSHLAAHGVFMQWLPLYQMDEATLRTIVATFLRVFPQSQGFLALYNVETPALGLLGAVAPDALPLAPDLLQPHLTNPALQALALSDGRDVLASRILAPDGLSEFSRGAAINTDLMPRVTFLAPRAQIDAETGLRNLEVLLEFHQPLAGLEGFDLALRHHLDGEAALFRESAPGVVPTEAIDAWLAAYAAAPQFPAARGRLYAVAAADADDAERIFEAMLEITPNERRIFETWIRILVAADRRSEAEAVQTRATRVLGATLGR